MWFILFVLCKVTHIYLSFTYVNSEKKSVNKKGIISTILISLLHINCVFFFSPLRNNYRKDNFIDQYIYRETKQNNFINVQNNMLFTSLVQIRSILID